MASKSESSHKEENGKSSKFRLSFFNEVKEEIKRVDWPSSKELISFTKVAILATFGMALGIYFTDMVLQTVIKGFGTVVRWITG